MVLSNSAEGQFFAMHLNDAEEDDRGSQWINDIDRGVCVEACRLDLMRLSTYPATYLSEFSSISDMAVT
jgi:hypothetical protein